MCACQTTTCTCSAPPSLCAAHLFLFVLFSAFLFITCILEFIYYSQAGLQWRRSAAMMADKRGTSEQQCMKNASSSSSSSWVTLLKRLVSTCKFDGGEVQVKESQTPLKECCSESMCNLRQVVQHRGETNRCNGGSASASGESYRGMHLKRWSGCYECHMIVDPIEPFSFSRDSFRIRPTTICACPFCGDIFTKPEALQHHQIIKHAVSEVGEEDSGRNVVEMIFQSSWLNKENPICKIERILKVHNSQKTMNKFEEYREMVKAKKNANVNANAHAHARCIADGNELLRFHCTTFACSLGTKGSSSLCALSACNLCNLIKNGFSSSSPNSEIYTTATSGRAHHYSCINTPPFSQGQAQARAMVVCRVIAGRVLQRKDKDKDSSDQDHHDFDSVAGQPGMYSNLEELFVYNSKAVLPCFLVIYKTLQG